MKKIIILVAMFIMLCSVFVFADTFDGYPCQGDCAGHQAGYDWAKRNNVTNINQCQSASQSFTEGCISYVRGGRGIIERMNYYYEFSNNTEKSDYKTASIEYLPVSQSSSGFNILESKSYHHWSASLLDVNNTFVFMLVTQNIYQNNLSIMTRMEYGQPIVSMVVSKFDTYVPAINEQRMVSFQVDNQPVVSTTASVTAGDGRVSFGIDQIDFSNMFKSFMAGNNVTFTVENGNNPIFIQFSLLGFTRSFQYMIELWDEIWGLQK